MVTKRKSRPLVDTGIKAFLLALLLSSLLTIPYLVEHYKPGYFTLSMMIVGLFFIFLSRSMKEYKRWH